MKNKRPYIFITNDDGVSALGINVLTKLMCQIGDVIVVAPDGARSGMSNALTVVDPIRYKTIEKSEKLSIYSCTGTPTDCVKLGFEHLIERTPDLVVSGINHGSNAAINVIYSGTMGAVLEACQKDVPAVGFSLCDHSADADFSYFEPFILKICQKTLQEGLPQNVCLNVNAPIGEIKGIKVARQCRAKWVNEFDKKEDENGTYFQLTGQFNNIEPDKKDTDQYALNEGFVSVVPVKTDLTEHQIIKNLEKWDL